MARSLAVLGMFGGSARVLLCVGAAFAASACFFGAGGGGREASAPGFRSPSHDYQQEQRVAGGDVLGADRKSAADKLAEGATQKSLAPGWSVQPKSGLSFDPSQRVGGEIDPPHEVEAAKPAALP